jgi:hypothetical protein
MSDWHYHREGRLPFKVHCRRFWPWGEATIGAALAMIQEAREAMAATAQSYNEHVRRQNALLGPKSKLWGRMYVRVSRQGGVIRCYWHCWTGHRNTLSGRKRNSEYIQMKTDFTYDIGRLKRMAQPWEHEVIESVETDLAVLRYRIDSLQDLVSRLRLCAEFATSGTRYRPPKLDADTGEVSECEQPEEADDDSETSDT